MKWLKYFVYLLLSLYLLICGVLFFVQDKVIFHPDKLPENYQFKKGEEVEIEVDNNIFLNCLWMKEQNSKGVILYLHGNKGSIRRCAYQAGSMTGNQYDIFMPDYRGYGKSDGYIFNETQVFSDAQKIYDFLLKHYKENEIIVVGYSLGSSMASYLSANNEPQQLVLIAPFVSIINLKNRMFPFIPNFLLKYPFNNYAYLKKVNCPITLFHGTADQVIPYDSSQTLSEINPKNIQLITLKKESHRGAIFNSLFKNTFSTLTN